MRNSSGRLVESPMFSKSGASRRAMLFPSSEWSSIKKNSAAADKFGLVVSLPMTWQAAAAFLACARIGAVHSAVFAGFSAESLGDRVRDCECKVVITTE